MSGIESMLQRNLQVLGTGRELARLADKVLSAYPDPYQLAVTQASVILRKHTGKDWDPRQVWWHQFSRASSSHRSFTGWAHSSPPAKSLRFTELMVERFDPGFQEATDSLDLYGGFYRQGPHAHTYDERNEVPMLARDVQQDFWALDFAQLYRRQISAFWAAYQDDFRLLAKVNLLGQCARAERGGYIDSADAAQLRAHVVPGLSAGERAPSLAQLREQSSVELRASGYGLGVASGAAIYAIQGPGTRVLLYCPWAEQALRGFDNLQGMAGWLREHLATAQGRGAFQQALIADPQDLEAAQAVQQALQALGESPSDAAALAVLKQQRSPVGHLLDALVEHARQEMQHTAARLVDNSQLRKALWRGYLGAFLKVFGGFVPLGWPVSLVLLGATLAKVGLEVDGALHARNAQERKAAMRTAILDSIFGALNMVDVSFGSSLASLTYQAPFHELDASLAEWEVEQAPTSSLAGDEANELLDSKPMGSDRLQGIRLGTDGSCWIELEGLPYRVRFSPELSSWLIVPPENPYAFGPLRPVRMDAAGEWQLLVPPRLLGGAPTDGLASEPSAFWDEYMHTHLDRSQTLSNAARARQRALLQGRAIDVLDDEQEPLVDEDGFDFIDREGEHVYTYRHDGEYRNHRIFMYTEEDGAKINRFLREGEREFDYGDEVEYLDNLADDLGKLPHNNDVPLYRGGHGTRSTSGTHFRSGQFKVGDVLVNTDLTSFTENPYIVRLFAADNDLLAGSGVEGVFDDSSVVFELPAGSYQHGTPISPFSSHPNEAETLFLPGSYFRVEALKEIRGGDYHFVSVRLSEVPRPASGEVYELRTGELFDKAAYAARLGSAELANRFFPD
ncbi:ADP-ribosyltransferase [Pseudomonas sichuanensis]|uniref:ADP-ribosyltransferase n=1 Tax=Pseudomonas sichuanensis TaxID=2213015 RepID=UPI002160DCBA|nr:ADP-ribosyltransferase [Pseudomonas sichuanensis]UVL90571.1 ADP-ribosyltransferase [Pseudomonas sichuanensis]